MTRSLGTAVVLCVMLAGAIWPKAGWGHAFPRQAEPRVGATVAAPSMVRIWFDGDLEPVFSKLTVQDLRGRQVDKGDGRVDPSDAALLEVTLPPLPAGTYHVFWSAFARDGHRTEGDYTFSVK